MTQLLSRSFKTGPLSFHLAGDSFQNFNSNSDTILKILRPLVDDTVQVPRGPYLYWGGRPGGRHKNLSQKGHYRDHLNCAPLAPFYLEHVNLIVHVRINVKNRGTS
jgi:hypothetical protein